MRILFLIMVMTLIGFSAKAQNKAALGTIVNNIKAGPLTGNKNLAFGVKNVLQEALQDKGFTLVDRFDADYVIDIEISFFDVEQTKQARCCRPTDFDEGRVRPQQTIGDLLFALFAIKRSASVARVCVCARTQALDSVSFKVFSLSLLIA